MPNFSDFKRIRKTIKKSPYYYNHYYRDFFEEKKWERTFIEGTLIELSELNIDNKYELYLDNDGDGFFYFEKEDVDILTEEEFDELYNYWYEFVNHDNDKLSDYVIYQG